MLFLAAVLAPPLAVVFGVLWSYLTALGAPPRRGEPIWSAHRRQLLCYLVLFLAVVALGATRVVPEWGMQIDEERDFMLSALCADGKGCPLFGNEMNQLRIKLGPLNRYLLTLCQLITPDPRFALWLILGLHALAAAWLAAAGDRLLGFPFGLLAGLLFGTNGVLLDVIAAASNGAWSSIFIVGGIAGTLRWISGEPRALIVAVTCLAAASQLHGTNLALVPPFLFAAAWWRPPTSRRVLVGCVVIVAGLYSSWLVYQWKTGWNDFSLISTSWMLSRGPDPMGRIGRVVPSLGGLLVAPLALGGAAVLATSRVLAASEIAAGRALLLFLALPLGATLLAGGSWTARYGAPLVAPGALAAAAAWRGLASLLPLGERSGRRYRFVIAATGLALVAGIALQGGWELSRQAVLARSSTQLGLAEQIETIRVLGEHGFGAADLESRVHGAPWTRWGGGQVYLGSWLIGARGRAKSGEHAAIVECERVPDGFASWQHRLASSRLLPYILVGYSAQLAPVTAELIGRGAVLWTSNRAVPFYGQMTHGGDAQMRALFDPRLAYPSEFGDLQLRWQGDPPRKMRLTTKLAPGRDDRAIVLTYDAGSSAAVTVGGAPGRHLVPAELLGDSVRERYLVKTDERRVEVVIEAVIDFPPQATVPRRVDLYEEPPCAVEAGDPSRPELIRLD